MPSATYVKFHCFIRDLGLKVHNLDTDTLKVMLTTVAPVAATNEVKADLTEISAGNGYTAGGVDISATWNASGGTATLDGSNQTITASGGTITYRYAVLYNATTASGNLIAYYDYGLSQTLQDGEGLAIEIPTVLATLT